jgi:hypothetical protein
MINEEMAKLAFAKLKEAHKTRYRSTNNLREIFKKEGYTTSTFIGTHPESERCIHGLYIGIFEPHKELTRHNSLMKKIAPYVKNGSVLICKDNDEIEWGYIFYWGKLIIHKNCSYVHEIKDKETEKKMIYDDDNDEDEDDEDEDDDEDEKEGIEEEPQPQPDLPSSFDSEWLYLYHKDILSEPSYLKKPVAKMTATERLITGLNILAPYEDGKKENEKGMVWVKPCHHEESILHTDEKKYEEILKDLGWVNYNFCYGFGLLERNKPLWRDYFMKWHTTSNKIDIAEDKQEALAKYFEGFIFNCDIDYKVNPLQIYGYDILYVIKYDVETTDKFLEGLGKFLGPSDRFVIHSIGHDGLHFPYNAIEYTITQKEGISKKEI